MEQILWIVDDLLSENAYEGAVSIADAAKELGHHVLRTKYVPFSSSSDSPFQSHYDYKFDGKKVNPSILAELHLKGLPTVVHGTIEFCKLFEKHVGKNYCPGLYFNKNVKHWSKFAAYLGSDLLNSDYVILPFAEAKRRHIAQEVTFIKPESGLKEFTGQVVNYVEDFDKMSPYHKIDPDTLCVVSPAKDIKAEFRYVIADKKVITGSEYRWDNKLDVRTDTHPLCDAMARKVAEADWQADSVYVCDVALLGPERYPTAKVVELNAFSSSGLYACDTRKIVEAVSKAAYNESRGEGSFE